MRETRFIPNSFLFSNVFGLHAASSLGEQANVVVDAFKKINIPIVTFDMDLSKHLPSNEVAPNLYIFVRTIFPNGIMDLKYIIPL